MKAKLQHRVFHPGLTIHKRKIDFLDLANKSLQPIGTCSLIVGIGTAAAMGMNPISDYLLAAGVLLHFASWFGDWWEGK